MDLAITLVGISLFCAMFDLARSWIGSTVDDEDDD